MRIRSHRVVVLAVAGLMVVGIGAGVAMAQSASPSPSPEESQAKAEARDSYLDGIAERLGIERSALDDALKAMALDEVQWKEDNGFITAEQADEIRQRIESGEVAVGRVGFHGPPGVVSGERSRIARHDGGEGFLAAAADYLGLTESDLAATLRSSTLGEVAEGQGKSVEGLEQALRDAREAELDQAVTAGGIDAEQEQALLERFDAEVQDLVNGIPHSLTDLAARLGLDRAKLISAVKGAAIDQVDEALAQGLITQAQADELKERIEASPAWPLGIGGCGELGLGHGPRFGPRFGSPQVEGEALGL